MGRSSWLWRARREATSGFGRRLPGSGNLPSVRAILLFSVLVAGGYGCSSSATVSHSSATVSRSKPLPVVRGTRELWRAEACNAGGCTTYSLRALRRASQEAWFLRREARLLRAQRWTVHAKPYVLTAFSRPARDGGKILYVMTVRPGSGVAGLTAGNPLAVTPRVRTAYRRYGRRLVAVYQHPSRLLA